jgi:hypothetical protein
MHSIHLGSFLHLSSTISDNVNLRPEQLIPRAAQSALRMMAMNTPQFDWLAHTCRMSRAGSAGCAA